MLTKCRDISARMNELENEINNIIYPERKITFSKQIPELQNIFSVYHTQEPKGDATDGYTFRDNHPNIKNSRPKTPADTTNDVTIVPKNPTNEVFNKSYTIASDSKYHMALADHSKYTDRKPSAEKENGATTIKEKHESIPIISIKNPPDHYEKLFSMHMLKNPLNLKGDPEGKTRNILRTWSNDGKIDAAAPQERKVDNNFSIESLQDEIEKVRHKLDEIRNNAQFFKQDIKRQGSKEAIILPKTSSGDYNNQSLFRQFKDIQMKNNALTKKLEAHKQLQESSMKKAKDANYLLNAYEKKVNDLHEQALKSSKIMADSREKFCNILRSRNVQIKSLFDANQELIQNNSMNVEQMTQLKNNYKLLSNHYQQMEGKEIETRGENISLRDTIKNMADEIKIIHKECSSLKEENLRIMQELNSARKNVENQYNDRLIRHQGNVEKIIRKNTENESKLIEEIDVMSRELFHQTSELENSKLGFQNDTVELQTKYHDLLTQYQFLAQKFHEYEQFDEIKCKCIEQELREFSTKMKEKESIVIKERDELRVMVEELAHTLKYNKSALRQLKVTNQRQETIIYDLNCALKHKDDQIFTYKKELREVHKKCEHLEEEIENLKRILMETENHQIQPEKDANFELLESMRKDVDQERDNNFTKQKIIDNQEQTISMLQKQIDEKSNEIEKSVNRLCEANEETNRLMENLKIMESELEKEKEEKKNIQKELTETTTHKETLSQQISELKDTIQKYRSENVTSKEDRKNASNELHEQFEQQKKDWEMQRMNLQKDKEKALHAAKFASQKLLDTVNDFQKQMSEQKCVQNKLKMILQGKEEQLESLTAKVESLLPHQEQPKGPLAKNSCKKKNICASFCQIQQIYPGPGSRYHSAKSVKDQESKPFCSEESEFCAICE